MSVLTSTKLNGVELLTAGTYWVHQNTYFALWSAGEYEPRLVDMAGRHPAWVGSTPRSRQIAVLVMLLAPTAAQRASDYQSLVSSVQSTAGLVALTWTENTVTRRYWGQVQGIEPSRYMTRAAITLVVPNPEYEVV